MTTPADAAAPTPCRQCGLPLARPARATAAASPYCCLGCELAAAIGGDDRGTGSPARANLLLARMGLAAFLSMNVMMIAFALFGATAADGPLPGWVTLLRWLSLLLALPAMAILVPPLCRSAFSRAGGTRLRVELLVVVAAMAAFAISVVNTLREQGDVWFDTATMVLLVVLLGSWLSARARTQARAELERRFAADEATFAVRRGAAALELPAAELACGDAITLPPGSRVPVDGEVVTAQDARLDGALLTGEPELRRVAPGDAVRAGEVVRSGSLLLAATRVGADSTLGRMKAALARALLRPPATARAVDVAARLLVLAAAGCAVGVLIWGAATGRFEAGLTRALALLVVACPCSIGIAAPLTLTRALAAAARHGAVVQSLEGFERLGRIAAVASDKTGTLTEGDAPTLRLCDPAGNALIAEEFARHAPLLAALAHASQHPIARALRDRLAGIEPAALAEVVEIPGRGVLARTLAGTAVTLERAPQPAGDRAPGELRSTLRLAGTPVLEVALREQLRPGVATLGSELRRRGIDLLIFSGDDSRRVEPIACALGGEGFGELLPEQKATLLAARRDRDRGIAWLGDGANDAIALAGADVSLVVDRRLEWLADAADLVLLGDRVGALPQLIDVARRARARIVTALAWAAIYHAATLTLGVLGLLTPALAALAMALGSIAVVRLALRPLDAAVDVSVALSVAASTKAPRPGPAPARRSPVPSVAAGATSS